MQKQAPTLGRILVMAGFALSCFGLILFLWVAFGGPVPFAAKGYRVSVNFNNAGQLANQADVRISGVPVGKVASVELGPRNSTHAQLQIDPRYSPIPSDTRAILRTKTLLGETYVELTPGNRANGVPLPDGGLLPEKQVRPQVTIDQIFKTFDAPTRKGFQDWQQGAAGALAGRGGDLNDAFGNLPSFTDSADQLMSVLNSETAAVQSLVRDTGTVFTALAERKNQFQQLITNSNAVFTTTAQRNQQLAETFQVLPTFESESTKTMNRLKSFAQDADPLVLQLQPAAEQLSPILSSVGQLAQPLKTINTKLGPLVDASAAGVPALGTFLNGSGAKPGLSTVLGQLDLFLQQLNPMLDFVGQYKQSLTAFLGNAAATTQATDSLPTPWAPTGEHYLRALAPLNALSLAAFPSRPTTNRTTPYYSASSGALPHSWELKGYEIGQCSGVTQPNAPTTADAPDDPGPQTPPYDVNATLTQALKAMAFSGTTNAPFAPACTQQSNVPGFSTLFPLITQAP
ncbi:MAG: MlaD family protein [Solirubrobacterales bacterium]|nr:MlaD family protein [Solirubrobacterales bacterium]